MSLALFVTHAAPTTVYDQALEAGLAGGVRIFFIAEPEDGPHLERIAGEGTKTPIPKTWRVE